MNLILKNIDFLNDGIFGLLVDVDGNVLFHTLQHAYDSGQGNGSYAPKLKPGDYNCVRGLHRLERMTQDFTTFEITNVPGHTNILFHVGNYNEDSEGCVLLGLDEIDSNGKHMLISSRVAFQEFMELLKDLNSFTLTVE